VSSNTFDSMHVYFSNGICGFEMWNLMRRLVSKRISWARVEAWFQSDFEFPGYTRVKGRALSACFSEARKKAAKNKFKGMASELLMLMPLMRHFLTTVVALDADAADSLKDEITSFSLLEDVVKLLQKAKTMDDARAIVPELAEKIAAHHAAFQTAYGSRRLKPKHHMAFHIPGQILRDGLLLVTFVLERKHQVVKQAAASVRNYSAFDGTVLVRSIQGQLRQLEDAGVQDKLVGTQSCDVNGVAVARAVRWNGLTIQEGDMLLAPDPLVALVVECGIKDQAYLGVVATPLELVADHGAYSMWSGLDNVSCVAQLEYGMRPAFCWYENADGSRTVLHQ